MALILVLTTGEALSGCAGDCFTCHENLIGDPVHKPLGTCDSCHNSSRTSLSLFPKANVNGGCGDRCFQCHKQWPFDSFHLPLDECLSCHEA